MYNKCLHKNDCCENKQKINVSKWTIKQLLHESIIFRTIYDFFKNPKLDWSTFIDMLQNALFMKHLLIFTHLLFVGNHK